MYGINPKAIQKLAEHIYKEMSEEDKKSLARYRPDESTLLHFSLGMHIRNNYGLWGSNGLWDQISHDYKQSPVIFDPDSISDQVIKQLIKRARAEFLRHLPRFIDITTELAGTFAGDFQAVQEAKKGQRIILERESCNRHDGNAVKILNRHGLKLGYLPRAIAEKIARDLDEGFRVRNAIILSRADMPGNIGLTVKFRIDLRKREYEQQQQFECPQCGSSKVQSPTPESQKWQCRSCDACWGMPEAGLQIKQN